MSVSKMIRPSLLAQLSNNANTTTTKATATATAPPPQQEEPRRDSVSCCTADSIPEVVTLEKNELIANHKSGSDSARVESGTRSVRFRLTTDVS